jgi:hypothetical protein
MAGANPPRASHVVLGRKTAMTRDDGILMCDRCEVDVTTRRRSYVRGVIIADLCNACHDAVLRIVEAAPADKSTFGARQI